MTGASDNGRSGVATYAQAGASFGFGFLWTALLTFPLMAGVQEICDRTALATGKGLGELATERLTGRGRSIVVGLVGLLIVANALNVAADLVAVGSGMHLLHAGPPALWALIAGAAISALLVSGSFELLCLALLAYIAMLLVVNVKWGSVAYSTFVPHRSVGNSSIVLLVNGSVARLLEGHDD
ncbi:MAG: divalent metal cation transporter [Gaiellaceae bacterium]